VSPTALRVLSATTGLEIVRVPLGEAEQRYGAPYWVIHRGDLQAALTSAIAGRLDVVLKLGMQVEDFVAHRNGVTVSARGRGGLTDERGLALLAADGLWSLVRRRLGHDEAPRSAGRAAWRCLIPAKAVAPEFREPLIHLWLGRDAHLVHYPVKSGRAINVVAITADSSNAPGWSEPAGRADFVAHLAAEPWAPAALSLVRLPEAWLKWTLYDRAPVLRWSQDAVALLGDAAHPMLQYLAQGACMATEDAVWLAEKASENPDDLPAAFRAYVQQRYLRTARVQIMARVYGEFYHARGPAAELRNQMLGGRTPEDAYDGISWLYGGM
jgi:salicylate hydroxylase